MKINKGFFFTSVIFILILAIFCWYVNAYIVVDGEIKPEINEVIISPSDAIIKKVYVKEADKIVKDTNLFSMIIPSEILDIKKQINEYEIQIKKIEVEISDLQKELDIKLSLLKQKLVDNAEIKNLNEKKNNLYQQKNILGNIVILEKKKLNSNFYNFVLDDTYKNTQEINIKSGIAGKIINLSVVPLDRVNKGDLILEVADFNTLIIKAFIYEREIEKVKVGQKVAVYSKTFKGKVKGEVISVGLKVSLMDKISYEKGVKIKIKILNDSKKKKSVLTPGATVKCRIRVI